MANPTSPAKQPGQPLLAAEWNEMVEAVKSKEDEVITQSELATTANQPFSGNFKRFQIEGFDIVRKKSDKIRVLIIGSSNGTQAAASSYAVTWAGKLESYLQAAGYETRNVSIGGTKTQDTLDRFTKDVLTWNPSIVIEATALWNEGLYGNNYDAPNTALRNIAKIAGLCEQQGIKFLKGPVLAYTGNTNERRHSLTKFYAKMLDKYVISASDGCAEGNGIFPAFNAGDGIHMNDAGNEEIFNSLNIERITANSRFQQTINLTAGKGFHFEVSQEASNQTGEGLILKFDDNRKLNSFTIALQVKFGVNIWGRTILSFGGVPLRVRHAATDSFDFAAAGTDIVKAGVAVDAEKYYNIVVSYNKKKEKVKFFFDNELVGEAAVNPAYIPDGEFPFLKIGNRVDQIGNFVTSGYSYRNVLVYRAELDNEKCINMYSLPISQASLVLASTLDEFVPTGGRFLNQACSNLSIENTFVLA